MNKGDKVIMGKPNYIEHIPAELRKDMILYRLGFRKNKTILDAKQEADMERTIKEGMLLCD
jgi:hypothetical protein